MDASTLLLSMVSGETYACWMPLVSYANAERAVWSL